MTIKNISLFFLFLLTFPVSAFYEVLPQFSNFADCVLSNNRWDYQDQLCYPGRTWIPVPADKIALYNRPFTQEEIDVAIKAFKYDPNNLEVCQQENPKVFVIVGPAGSGKSTILKGLSNPDYRIANAKMVDMSKYTIFDGDEIRYAQKDYYQYAQQLEIGYTNLADYISPNSGKIKQYLINEMTDNRCNIILSVTTKPTQLNVALKKNYDAYYTYIYLDYEETFLRGTNRGQIIGRTLESGSDLTSWLERLDYIINLSNESPDRVQIISNNGTTPRLMSKEEVLKIRATYQ